MTKKNEKLESRTPPPPPSTTGATMPTLTHRAFPSSSFCVRDCRRTRGVSNRTPRCTRPPPPDTVLPRTAYFREAIHDVMANYHDAMKRAFFGTHDDVAGDRNAVTVCATALFALEGIAAQATAAGHPGMGRQARQMREIPRRALLTYALFLSERARAR